MGQPGPGGMPPPPMPGMAGPPRPGGMPPPPGPGGMPGGGPQGMYPPHTQQPGMGGMPGGGMGAGAPRRSLDPDHMPSPIAVMEDDQRNNGGDFNTNEKVKVNLTLKHNFFWPLQSYFLINNGCTWIGPATRTEGSSRPFQRNSATYVCISIKVRFTMEGLA